jgi:hypothetical protein
VYVVPILNGINYQAFHLICALSNDILYLDAHSQIQKCIRLLSTHLLVYAAVNMSCMSNFESVFNSYVLLTLLFEEREFCVM